MNHFIVLYQLYRIVVSLLIFHPRTLYCNNNTSLWRVRCNKDVLCYPVLLLVTLTLTNTITLTLD